ncbi:hypothetical protein NDU88_002790 [Pleurodeles waltl]|uniref:Uncharacterized protein n=1 Tax=Pleurodeles waltl TaxID=8319 RepID=A0AAV7UAR9_PLEWA|nr:hypothetical protein NDU88_002790 [Pleurodeles waltl]
MRHRHNTLAVHRQLYRCHFIDTVEVVSFNATDLTEGAVNDGVAVVCTVEALHTVETVVVMVVDVTVNAFVADGVYGKSRLNRQNNKWSGIMTGNCDDHLPLLRQAQPFRG